MKKLMVVLLAVALISIVSGGIVKGAVVVNADCVLHFSTPIISYIADLESVVDIVLVRDGSVGVTYTIDPAFTIQAEFPNAGFEVTADGGWDLLGRACELVVTGDFDYNTKNVTPFPLVPGQVYALGTGLYVNAGSDFPGGTVATMTLHYTIFEM